MRGFSVSNELNTVFLDAIDQDLFADSFASISALVLVQIPTVEGTQKKAGKKSLPLYQHYIIFLSNEDMIVALAGQFEQLSHEPEKFR